MFDNISKLRFEQGPNEEPLANAMISSEGEMMEYRQEIVAEGKVEDWMTLVLNEMRRTNQLLTKESIFYYCQSKSRFWLRVCPLKSPFYHLCFFFRIDWMYDYQGMVVMTSNQVWWTWEVEDVFRKVKKGDKMGMKNYAKKLHSQIDDLVFQVRPIAMQIKSNMVDLVLKFRVTNHKCILWDSDPAETIKLTLLVSTEYLLHGQYSLGDSFLRFALSLV